MANLDGDAFSIERLSSSWLTSTVCDVIKVILSNAGKSSSWKDKHISLKGEVDKPTTCQKPVYGHIRRTSSRSGTDVSSVGHAQFFVGMSLEGSRSSYF